MDAKQKYSFIGLVLMFFGTLLAFCAMNMEEQSVGLGITGVITAFVGRLIGTYGEDWFG